MAEFACLATCQNEINEKCGLHAAPAGRRDMGFGFGGFYAIRTKNLLLLLLPLPLPSLRGAKQKSLKFVRSPFRSEPPLFLHLHGVAQQDVTRRDFFLSLRRSSKSCRSTPYVW